MKKQFATYKIALAIKELGFTEECMAFWFNREKKLSIENQYKGLLMCESNRNSDFNVDSNYTSAPLWQQVVDWFIEKYSLHIVITVNPYSEINEVNGYKIYNSDKNMTCVSNQETQSWSHYKAREQAILKAIELVKNQQV